MLFYTFFDSEKTKVPQKNERVSDQSLNIFYKSLDWQDEYFPVETLIGCYYFNRP